MGFANSPSPENASIAHWTRVHGHALYYETRGSGRPLLLLHGGGASISASFAQQLDAFARGHRLIAPEQIGQVDIALKKIVSANKRWVNLPRAARPGVVASTCPNRHST